MRHPYWSAVGTIVTLIVVFWQLVTWLLQFAQLTPQQPPLEIPQPIRNPIYCAVLSDEELKCWEGKELPEISLPNDARGS